MTTNWTNATASVDTPWQGGTTYFAGTAGTVTLGANIALSGMVFTTDGYLIEAPSPFTLVAAATSTIDVGPGA